MAVTVLPISDPNYHCAPKLSYGGGNSSSSNNTAAAAVSAAATALVMAQRVLKLLSGFGLTLNGQQIYCGDYIYSGHTMILLMTYLVIKECTYTSTVYDS